jgi:hypothetical protein
MTNTSLNPEIDILDFLRLLYKKKFLIIIALIIPISFFAYQVANDEKNFKITFQFTPLTSGISHFEDYNNQVLLFNEKNKLNTSITSVNEKDFSTIKPRQLYEIYFTYLKNIDSIKFEDILNDNENLILSKYFTIYSDQSSDLITLESRRVKDKKKWKNYILETNKNSEKFVRKVLLDNFLSSKKFFEGNADTAIKELKSIITNNEEKLEILLAEINQNKEKIQKYNLENYLYTGIIRNEYVETRLEIKSIIFNLKRQIANIDNSKIEVQKLHKLFMKSSIFKDDFKMVNFKNFQIIAESNLNYKYTLIVLVITVLFIILYVFVEYQKEQWQKN